VYEDEIDVGLLKNVLPLMSKHAAGYHPISYAVWYEYAKGNKPVLKQSVEAELTRCERLSPEVTYSLYTRHFVEPAEQALISARTGLMELVDKVQGAVGRAGKQAIGFDSHLKAFKQEITSAGSLGDLDKQVSAMVAESEKMSSGFGKLSDELEGSRSEVKRLTQELQQMREEALTDTLSGLLNRRGFDREIERLASHLEGEGGQSSAQLSVIMLDIDHFKKINDTYGHPLGDRVIAAVSQSIRDCVGKLGLAARYGGEEFAVLLPDQPLDVAEKLAQTIRHRIEQGRIRRRQGEEPIGGVTISAGVSTWKSADAISAVVERADQALYVSKKSGRNRVTTEALEKLVEPA
jgi:diguanylate cyclase